MAMAQGSGFFISADGYVVTNNHVVEHATDVTVTTADGKTIAAKVIGTDPKTDLALLKVKEGADYPFVTFAPQAPRVGDWVIAVGNPFGLGGTVTAGIVSARGRDIGAGPYDDFLQIDAPVNHGNSGGPTFNTEGQVVGVNTAIFSPSGGSVGIGFAIPSDVAKNVVAAAQGQRLGRARLARRRRSSRSRRTSPTASASRTPRARWSPRRRRILPPAPPASRPATSSPRSTASRSPTRMNWPARSRRLGPKKAAELGSSVTAPPDHQGHAWHLPDAKVGERRYCRRPTGRLGASSA